MQLLMPGLLWTMAAIAVPVLLHLSLRRVYREVHLGTLRFLHASTVPRKRRARLEEILLMLLRMAALALLSLVFLRPFLPGASKKATGHTGETLVLLDASGSITPEMAATARTEAARVLRDGRSQTHTLAAFADQTVTLANLDAYRPIPGAPTNTPAALKWALDHFRRNPSVTGRVVIISHLASGQLPSAVPLIWPPSIPVEVIPLTEPVSDNFSVSNISLLTPYAESEMEVAVSVTAPAVRKPLLISLQAEGVKLEQTLPPGRNTCSFRFPVPRKIVRGGVTIRNTDAWPDDNSRPFAFARIARQRVLLVDGRPGVTPFEGQPYFIGKALEASGAAHGKSPFLTETCFGLEDNRGTVDPTPFAAVALCGVGEVSARSAQVLASYVAKGGSLVHILNDAPPSSVEALAAANLLPAGLVYQEQRDPRVITRFEHGHPAFSPFTDKDYGHLEDLPWQQRYSLGGDPGWHPLLVLDNGAPLLWERTENDHRGRVMLLAHPLNRDWNDLPREPVFVPFVRNLFGYLTRLDAAPAEARTLHPGLMETRRIGYYLMPDESVELVVADPAEAVVKSVDSDRFRAAYGLPDAAVIPAADPPPPAGTPDISRAREWWPWAAAALLTILLLETWVATRPITAPTS